MGEAVRHELAGVLDLRAFSRLRCEWTQLANDSPTHSQSLTYEYCELAAAAALAKQAKLYVIKIYDDRGLVLLWPISVRRNGLVRVARDLRSDSGEEYGGPLLRALAADGVLREAVRALTRIDADLFELAWVDDGSALQLLIESVPQPWIVRHAPRRIRSAPGGEGMPRYTIHFAGFASWQDFIATRAHSVRRQHNNRLRKLLREQQDIEFGWCRRADEAETVLTWLFANKKDWAEARGFRTAYLMRPEMRDFCIAMARRTDLDTVPLVSFVKVGGRPIAASFNLVGPKSLEFFITTYDRAFHPYSPGILLLTYVAQWACENGRDFDMRYLHVDYKAHWANYTVQCRRHAVFLARGNAAAAVSLAGLAVGKIFASCRRRLSAIPWRLGGASARRLAEDDREIVGRHRDRFSQFKAMLGGKVRHLVQAAQPPGRIARLQARVESEVGGRGLDARLDIGAIEEQNAAGRQQAAGPGHQPLGR